MQIANIKFFTTKSQNYTLKFPQKWTNENSFTFHWKSRCQLLGFSNLETGNILIGQNMNWCFCPACPSKRADILLIQSTYSTNSRLLFEMTFAPKVLQHLIDFPCINFGLEKMVGYFLGSLNWGLPLRTGLKALMWRSAVTRLQCAEHVHVDRYSFLLLDHSVIGQSGVMND